MTHSLRRLLRCDSAMALVEFALVLPILLVLLIGTVEFARYAIIHQKLDKTASALADFITQGTTVTTAMLNGFAGTVPQIMEPYAFSGSVIFSSVVFFNTPLPPCTGADVSCISWQYQPVGAEASRIGGAGGNATLPGNYQVLQGQNAIVAEVFFTYGPMLAATGSLIPALAGHTIYKIAVYKPRQGTLTSLGS